MMCGYRIGSDDDIKQVEFSRSYHAAAEGSGIEVCDDWAEFVTSLMEQATGRKLFAFSEHEQKLIHKATGFWYRKRYENVRCIANHWRRRQHSAARVNTLVDFARLAKITVPANYGKGQVTEKLQTVREYSGSRRRWKTAPKAVRQSWDDLLAHNAFDVSVMYLLLCVIERDRPAPVAAA